MRLAKDEVQTEVAVGGEVAKVDQEPQVPGAPVVVQQRRQHGYKDEHAVVQGQDAQTAPRKEARKILRISQGVVQDARDQESRQDKEDIDTEPPTLPQQIQYLQQAIAMCAATIVLQKHKRYGQGTNTIQRRKPGTEIDRRELPGCRTSQTNTPQKDLMV